MTCPYCKFDPQYDSLVAEGSPCGIDNCSIYSCCTKSWEEHCEKYHKTEIRSEP